jgi:hypothetical protein
MRKIKFLANNPFLKEKIMKKQLIKDPIVLKRILDWFTNNYEFCDNVNKDAKTIFLSININNRVLTKDLAHIMELWLKNDKGSRILFETMLDDNSNDIINFINQRSKFFQI